MRTFAIFAATATVLAGCATHTPDASTSTQPLRETPGIKVALDCGNCQVRPVVPGLIAEGYREAAAKAGAKVAAGEEVKVSIREYAARDDAARFFAGAFAGKDEIKASVTYKDKQFLVEDYYRNAWLGIEHLARKIGEMVFERINQ